MVCMHVFFGWVHVDVIYEKFCPKTALNDLYSLLLQMSMTVLKQVLTHHIYQLFD